MALADAVQGALRPSQEIVWADADGVAVDLTGATITGRIQSQTTGSKRDVVGALVVTSAAAGIFRWSYAAADVAEDGGFWVQFTASFSLGATPERSLMEEWNVQPSI